MDKRNRKASLNLSPKVPVSLIILQLINLLSGKRKLQKSSKNRVAKWRANLTDENRKNERVKHAQLMRKHRGNQTDAEKQRARDLDKERKAKKWANMTEEEKSKHREKDRLRKAAKKEPAPENWRELPRNWKKPSTSSISYSEYLEKAQLYQEKRRQESTEAEREYERIYNMTRISVAP